FSLCPLFLSLVFSGLFKFRNLQSKKRDINTCLERILGGFPENL
ncbi:unnamed protein product, partial [Brassica oleracea var. botrytis]